MYRIRKISPIFNPLKFAGIIASLKRSGVGRVFRLVGLWFFLGALLNPSAANEAKPALLAGGETFSDLPALLDNIMPRSEINAVAFSPDDGYLATAGYDPIIHVWDLRTGLEQRRLTGHSGVVYALDFSPDGKWLASAGADRVIRIWDLSRGRPRHQLAEHGDTVNSLSFSYNGEYLASSSDDNQVLLWDTAGGQLLKRLDGHAGAVLDVEFSPVDMRLASASTDTTVALWNAINGELMHRLSQHNGAVNGVSFSPDGQLLAAACQDNGLYLWYTRSATLLQRLSGHTASIMDTVFSPDGHSLASGGYDKTVRLWDVATRREMFLLSGHENYVAALAFGPGGKLLASGGFDGTARLWNVQLGAEKLRLEGHRAPATSLAVSPDGKLLALGSDDQGITLWDWETLHEVAYLTGHRGAITTLAFSPGGKVLASGAYDNTVRLWSMESHREIHRLSGHFDSVRAVAFSPDGKQLVSGGYDKTVRLWWVETGRELQRLEHEPGAIHSLAFSPDGRWLAAGARGNTVPLWNLEDSGDTRTLVGHSGFINAVTFSPDGRYIATASGDNTVRLWDAESGEPLRVMRGHRNFVQTVAFSPDSRLLASGGGDNLAMIWEVETGELRHKLEEHQAFVMSVAFSAEGKWLATASSDGNTHLWNPRSGKLAYTLISGRRGTWINCRIKDRHCWRFDDGSLLLRQDEQGRMHNLPPGGGQQGEISLQLQGPFPVEADNRHLSRLELKARNTGNVPLYWLRLISEQHPNLLFYPPPLRSVLSPGEDVSLQARFNAWLPYLNPRGQQTELKLRLDSANAPPASLNLTVKLRSPNFSLNSTVPPPFVERDSLHINPRNTGDLNLPQTEFIAYLHPGAVALDRVIRQRIPPGEMLHLSFALPENFRARADTRVSLSVRKLSHPSHVWQLPPTPVNLPTPSWHGYLLLGLLLTAIVMATYYLWLYRHPLVISLSHDHRELLNLPLGQLFLARRLLYRTHRLHSILSHNQIQLRELDKAVVFRESSAEQQACYLAERLGARCQRLTPALFRWELHESFPLNLTNCLVYIPGDDVSPTEILNHLRQSEDMALQKIVLIALEPEQQQILRPYGEDPACLWVVPNHRELSAWLLDPEPVPRFAATLATQLKVTQLSPYQTRSGLNKDTVFFGRTQILSEILNRDPSNYLLVGARQIGKSSLLKHIQRRYHEHPLLDCHYITLQNDNLQGRLAIEMGLPGDASLDSLLACLANVKEPGQRRLILIDEADLFIHGEMHKSYHTLSHLRGLAEEGRCHFILAGFWELYKASVLDYQSPLKNFGEPVTLGALEYDACHALLSQPMRTMGLSYASPDLMDDLIEATGQRANLLAIVCHEMLKGLKSGQRVFTGEDVQRALYCDAVYEALSGWENFTEDETANRLDRIIVYATAREGEFTQTQVMHLLDRHGYPYTPEQFRQSLARLSLSFIVQRLGHGRYAYCIPLFQEMLLEDEVEELLERELQNGLVRRENENIGN